MRTAVNDFTGIVLGVAADRLAEPLGVSGLDFRRRQRFRAGLLRGLRVALGRHRSLFRRRRETGNALAFLSKQRPLAIVGRIGRQTPRNRRNLFLVRDRVNVERGLLNRRPAARHSDRCGRQLLPPGWPPEYIVRECQMSQA